MHFGIDISSNNQHPIDYNAVVAHLKQLGGGDQPFVIVKATEGTGYVNPFFQSDVLGFRNAGAAVGAYLMDHGSANVSAEEAAFRRVAGALPQFDDDELPDGMGNTEYAQHTSQLLAENPVAVDYLNQSEENSGFPEGDGDWEANYNKQPGVVHSPKAIIHQFDNQGVIPGAPGYWDLNAWLGSEEKFHAVFHEGPVPAPAQSQAEFVGGAAHPNQDGFWLVKSDGAVFTYGEAKYHGGANGIKLAKPVVGMASTPSGDGYWLVAADGGVFAFGDAKVFGNASGANLARPVFGIVPTSSGRGYRLLAADGGVFNYGDAKQLGSAAGK